MNEAMTESGQIEIYQTDDGQTQIQVRLEKDTLWLSQAQMSELFETDQSGIARHLKNIFETGELIKDSVYAKFAYTAKDGKQYKTNFYSLDAIISVGYRVNSKKGTRFRIWATQRLREYLVQGYSINQQRFSQNAAELEQALALIRKAAQAPSLASDMGRGLVDIMGRYTQTFLWLQQYDEGLLEAPKGESGGVLPSPRAAMDSLAELKGQLMARGEASDLFARSSTQDSLAGIFGNLDQTVFGDPAYPTIESKAAHLLYFVSISW